MTSTGVISLREYARSRKARQLDRPLSLKGVQDAIASGRLQQSIVHVPGKLGRLEPKIADAALADRELAATHVASQDSRQEAAAEALQADPAARVLPPGPAPDAAQALDKDRADYARLRREIAEHERAKKEAEATLRTLDAAERGGKLVKAREVEDQVEELCRSILDRAQALPVVVGRQIAFSMSLDESRTIEACNAAMQNWLRDLAADLTARAGTTKEAIAA